MIPKYSIFLPVHNGGEYLKECLESILGQDYPHFQIEVLENCSQDGSREWLEALTDHRVRIWPSDRLLSIEENWHRIVSIPKNEFMTMIGHDDLLDTGFLSEINGLIEKNSDASLFLTHFRVIDLTGKFSYFCKPIPKIEYAHEFLALRFLWLRDSYGTGYVMRSRDYEKVGGIPKYHKLLFADDSLWYKISKISYKATSPKCCFSYRYHQGSLSGKVASGDILKAFTGYKVLLLDEVGKSPNLRNVIERYLPNFLNFFFEIELNESQKLGKEEYSALKKSIKSIYSEFAIEFPFEKKEQKKRLGQRIKQILKFLLPGGITDYLKKFPA
jgi:glycosyltransferase involved in cell wall biosynthesis